MKTIPLILAALITAPGAALAHHPEEVVSLAHRGRHPHSHVGRVRRGVSGVNERTCYKEVYRERYIPGTAGNPGRVRRWTEQKEIPCSGAARPRRRHHHHSRHTDDNSCIGGTIVGGIAGGTVGAIASRDEGRIWAIPLGVVTGAMVGCAADGG